MDQEDDPRYTKLKEDSDEWRVSVLIVDVYWL